MRRRRGVKLSHPAGHINAPAMTKNLFVKLKYATDTTSTTTSSWRFGLAQFWNQLPGYYTQYMTIYKMSRIVNVHVKCTVVNLSAATPAELVLCILPFSDYSKTIDQVKLLPTATYRYLSGMGGLDRVSVAKSANLNSWLGVDSRSLREYQQSASEAASTLALLPDTPVLAFYVGGASASEPTLRVFIECVYHVEFFLPEYPGSTALNQTKAKVPLDMTGTSPQVIPRSEDDEASWEHEPPQQPRRQGKDVWNEEKSSLISKNSEHFGPARLTGPDRQGKCHLKMT